MIRSAALAPTRGSSESCEASAELRLTTPDAEPSASAKATVDIAMMTRARVKIGRDFRMGLLLLFFSFVCLLVGWLLVELRLGCLFHTVRIGTFSFRVSTFSSAPPPFAGPVVQAGH